MDQKLLHRIFGLLSFVLAFVVYTMTVQPTVPFWDCGEFSAAAVWQQVPHPPGAPLFLMIGKLFHVLIPFGEQAWRINMVSVTASALTVWLIYLITVMVIKNLKKENIDTIGDALAVYGSAFIGAAALTFSDTFWFNAVESEVYAASSLFVGLIVWLMMKWNEEADNPKHERYLLLIFYLIGLSTGVHLLSILAIFSIVMVVYFRKYEYSHKSFIIMGIFAVITFFVIYPGVVKWLPSLLAGHSPSRNAAREYTIENSTALTFFAIAAIALIAYGFYYGRKKSMHILQLISAAFLLVLLGYTTYTQILLRSNANPPMNENEPKDFASLASYLGREQYGDAPFWPRRYEDRDMMKVRYNMKDASGEYEYGPWYPPASGRATRKDGQVVSVPEFRKINTKGELAYLWKYQINHMYFRYFGWNFVGRGTDVQDGSTYLWGKNESEVMHYDSGYADEFPIAFFALPFLLGLIGLLFHFSEDRKMAFSYLIMFLLMGVLTAIAQNQQDPQPRERDYFYAGSFMVWCIWIGLGSFGILSSLKKAAGKSNPAIVSAVLIVAFIIAPLNMAQGWKIHSRAGNYLPFDYSYNILQSTEKNAIIFTNGDNDTFPLWFIQDVAGVRRDVRVVNLSLGNTLWYVDQVKNRQPWGADKIPLSFADDSIQVTEDSPMALQYDFSEPRDITIPVRPEILAKYTDNQEIIKSGKWTFRFTGGKEYGKNAEGQPINLFRIQDKLILDILKQTRMERPVYFSATVGPDAFAGLDLYFRTEGMAHRICPVIQKTGAQPAIDPEILEQNLMNIDNSDNFSKTPKYGFKLRNLNNMDVYYDEVHRRIMGTYRHLYLTYADYFVQKGNFKKAAEVLDVLNQNISLFQFPVPHDIAIRMVEIYQKAGRTNDVSEIAEAGLKYANTLIENPKLREDLIFYEVVHFRYGPYQAAIDLYKALGDYASAKGVVDKWVAQIDAFRNQTFGGNVKQYEREITQLEGNKVKAGMISSRIIIEETEKQSGAAAALDTANSMMQRYQSANNGMISYFANSELAPVIQKLEEKVNPQPEAEATEETAQN